MEEENQEPKFFCKFCNKACFTGKSLGGHMRGHLGLIAAAKKQKHKSEASRKNHFLAKNQEISKNTSSSPSSSKKKKILCKKCGKRFSSVKGLSGHLKCHSRKQGEEDEEDEDHHRTVHTCKKCERDFDSIRALYGHMKIHSKRPKEEEYVHSLPNKEITLCPVRKKRSIIKYNKPTLSEIDDVQEAAMSLLMLSMGAGTWAEYLSAKEEFPVRNAEMPNSDYGDADEDDCNSEEKLSEQIKNLEKGEAFLEPAEFEVMKISKDYVCPICFKGFQSGQALGGHKRAHYTGVNTAEEMKVKRELNFSDDNIHNSLDLNLLPSMVERVWCLGNELLISTSNL
ncbi:unnamed protein product [Cuscuta epithymum]|uniref:C2H2-type domain-containing protein n=1 Tax=Cuscuta epithymum TaxID=186058 RepID=A0AAV0D4D7_9ASTE|nr:unnamed protein product [Cuscuta epithymum]CAH9118717.1 unnamed protein product [Cuscuta epithymum]